MQSKISRRAVLAGVPAMAATVPMPSEAIGGDELPLTRIAAFHEIYSTEAIEQWQAEHARVIALPDCPLNGPRPMGRLDPFPKFLSDHGVDVLAHRAGH